MRAKAAPRMTNGKPAPPESFLQWSKDGAAEAAKA